MDRSLTVAIANVESLLRKTIAAALALALETDELRGLARSSNELIPNQEAAELQVACQTLLIAMESALTSLVDARFRFRDWIAWLRATGSQIKARGTASNSVQRENAKKRRVPDDTIRRILRYLMDDNTNEDADNVRSSPGDVVTNIGMACEALLGIGVSHHWNSTERLVRPNSNRGSFRLVTSIPAAYRGAVEAAQRLFEVPSRAMKGCFRRFDFTLTSNPGCDAISAVSVTTRLGAGGLKSGRMVIW